MSAAQRAQRRARPGSRLSLPGGPMLPLVGVCVGVVALSAAVTLGGGDSGKKTGSTDAVTAADTGAPAALPPANSCVLREAKGPQPLSVPAARFLTQITAVGWQVQAPTEMIARVLDLAMAKPGTTLTTTQTLDLFTREDGGAPSAASVAAVSALSQAAALTCVFDPPAMTAEAKGKTGLTPRADAMRQALVDAFGKVPIGGYGPKLRTTDTAEADGRALSIALPAPAATAAPAAGDPGWVMAHWLAARGADYKLATIAYADHVWSPAGGWQSSGSDPATVTPGAPGSVYAAVVAGTPAPKPAAKHKAKKRS